MVPSSSFSGKAPTAEAAAAAAAIVVERRRTTSTNRRRRRRRRAEVLVPGAASQRRRPQLLRRRTSLETDVHRHEGFHPATLKKRQTGSDVIVDVDKFQTKPEVDI